MPSVDMRDLVGATELPVSTAGVDQLAALAWREALLDVGVSDVEEADALLRFDRSFHAMSGAMGGSVSAGPWAELVAGSLVEFVTYAGSRGPEARRAVTEWLVRALGPAAGARTPAQARLLRILALEQDGLDDRLVAMLLGEGGIAVSEALLAAPARAAAQG